MPHAKKDGIIEVTFAAFGPSVRHKFKDLSALRRRMEELLAQKMKVDIQMAEIEAAILALEEEEKPK